MIIYKYKILYFDDKKKEKIKKQFSDNNNIFNVTGLPEKTVAVFCMKYDKISNKYVENKTFFIGDKIKFQDVDKNLINLQYSKNTNSNYVTFLKYLRENFESVSKTNFVFKNTDKIFSFPRKNATLLPSNCIFDGKLNRSILYKPNFEDKSYLDLE